MNITVKELQGLVDKGGIQVVDVRSCGEYASGHIPGAMNVPVDHIESRLADLSHSGPVVLACHSGTRAQMACDLIKGRHPELLVLEGGTEAWIGEGLPVVQSTRTRWSLDRQTRLGAGVLVLTGTLLSLLVSPAWIYLAVFVGAGLTFAGATDICMMGILLARMPWNRPKQGAATEGAPARA